MKAKRVAAVAPAMKAMKAKRVAAAPAMKAMKAKRVAAAAPAMKAMKAKRVAAVAPAMKAMKAKRVAAPAMKAMKAKRVAAVAPPMKAMKAKRVALYMLANPLRFWSQADGAHWEPRGQATHLREVEGAPRRDRVVLSSSAYLVNVDAKQQKRKLVSFIVYLYVYDASIWAGFSYAIMESSSRVVFRHEFWGLV